ncbi:MAG: helix-turn-helix transcriptional regulator [Arcobacteraceae bacterium]|nr:helix-turn-helix transcriptional regulator [Arcobacteraceae bacterium]
MLGIAVIESGTINIEFNTSTLEVLKKNKLAIFNPKIVHCSKNTREKALGYSILYLSTEWCQSIQKKIFGKDSEFININANILNEQKLYNKFIILFKQIMNDNTSKNYENSLSEFITDIFKQYCDVNRTVNIKEQQYNQLANNIEKYITNNLDQDISLEDLSSYTGYNGTYLIRVFKKQFGFTPRALIINQKINKAKKMLLENKHLNLIDIACEVGFYDQSHFIKSFKRVFAVSPGVYKKSLL